MIRTRDFILFILTIIFLLIGISSTLIYEHNSRSNGTFDAVSFDNEPIEPNVALTTPVTEDREANLARLKEKLAKGEVLSVADIDTISVAPPPPMNSSGDRTVIYCSTKIDSAAIASTWPKTVSVREVEGARVVYEQSMLTASTASGTMSQIEEKPKLQLSLSQVRDAEDHCLSGEIIGITTTGSLLMNGSASSYAGVSELTLIGYALDGFPVYGVKSDTSLLDSCGGEQTPLGYRYYLRAGEPFILGCFAATPATLLNN